MLNPLQSLKVFLVAAFVLAGCRTKNPTYCEDHTWCTADPDKPFCDVEGEYEGLKRLCIEDPFGDRDARPKTGRDGGPGTADGEVVDGGAVDGEGTGGGGADGGGVDGPSAPDTSLSARLVVAPAEYDFGELAKGETSSARLFTVTNAGDAPSGKINVSVGETLHYAVVTNDCGPALSPGGTCSLKVAFAPDFVGDLPGTLTISSPSAEDAEADLRGKGLGSTVTSFDVSAEFGGHPSLTVDPAGLPIVAWRDNSSGSYRVYVKRFDGTTWHEVGAGSASGQGISGAPRDAVRHALAIDGQRRPVVVWSAFDEALGNDIYAMRFNGTTWQEVGSDSASGGGISDTGSGNRPSLAVDRNGRPVVAWSDEMGDSTGTLQQIYVKRFDGTSWVEVGPGSASGGGISNTPGWSYDPSLAVDGEGRFLVSWTEDLPERRSEIYVRRFDGTSTWHELGPGSASGGGMSDLEGGSDDATIVVGGSDQATVAWTYKPPRGVEGPFPRHIYVRTFDVEENRWIEASWGAASDDGISDGLGISDDSHVAVDALGRLVVAWEHQASDPGQIYVKRFYRQDYSIESTWSELVSGSATGKGFSSTSDRNGADPSVAVGGGRICIAWDEWDYDTTPARLSMRCVSD